MKSYAFAALFIGLCYVIPFYFICEVFIKDPQIMANKTIVVRGPLNSDWSNLYLDGVTDHYKIKSKQFIKEIDSSEGYWKLTLELK